MGQFTRLLSSSVTALCLLTFIACEGSKESSRQDVELDLSPADMGFVDMGLVDTGLVDTGLVDMGSPADMALVDMSAPDPLAVEPRPPPRATPELEQPEGFTWARGLIHMHSVHSHDACDGDPKPGGEPNAPCLADLRAAVCSSRLDFMLLTDHPESFAEVSFEEATLHDPSAGDSLIYAPPVEGEREGEGGALRVIGNALACPEGRSALIAPGSEGALMPVMLTSPPADPAWYRARAPESVEALKAAGALVLHAHTEERTFEELWPLGLDGFELYNLHANVNPRWQQLSEVIPDLTRFLNAIERPPHPDLVLLALLRENRWALETYDRFIARRRTLGVAGSDIHQNLPPSLFRTRDGERFDSYRRLTRWFANYLLVRERTLEGVREALLEGRAYAVFHLLGEPEGVDFSLTDLRGERHEVGAEVPYVEAEGGRGLTLTFTPPHPPPGATLHARLLRASALGEDGSDPANTERVVVAEGAGSLSVTVNTPGAYRAEVYITPKHLRSELGELGDLLVRPTPWVYSNPIYVW